MREGRLVLGLLMSLCVVAAGLAAQVPVSVSPGSLTGTVIGDACPTLGTAGNNFSTTLWTDAGTETCRTRFHLYCFQD